MRLGLETFGGGSESVKLEVGGGKGLGENLGGKGENGGLGTGERVGVTR